MKTYTILLFFVLTVFALSCEKQSVLEEYQLFSDDGSQHLISFSVDNDGVYYYVSQEFDRDTVYPLWSSSIPMKYKLYKQQSAESGLELVNDEFKYPSDFIFDDDNAMIVMTHCGLARIKDEHEDFLLSQSLNCFAQTSDNAIWAGDFASGLYHLSAQGDSINFNTDNSLLPTNSINALYVDKQDVLWAALWSKQGLLKIEDEEWTIFNASNSNLFAQNIWCMAADWNNHLWVGMGFDDASKSLMRYDGAHWLDASPLVDGKAMIGTVRHLLATPNKLYVVSVFIDESTLSLNRLLVYDGDEWEVLDLFPEEDMILDIEYDSSRGQVGVLTTKNKLYRIDDE